MDFNPQDIIAAALLAYYTTGRDKVAHDSGAAPLYRPGYVGRPLIWRFFAGAAWPWVSWANRELAWYSVGFLSSAIFFLFGLMVLLPYIGSPFWTLLVLTAAPITPIIGNAVNAVRAVMAVILWYTVAHPFGAKIPPSVTRASE